MSLSFKQIYIKDISARAFLEKLNMQSSVQFKETKFYDKASFNSVSPLEIKKEIQDTSDLVIYKQYGVCVFQTSNRNRKTDIEPDIQKLSEDTQALVVWIDHYESYVTNMKIFEKGAKVLEVMDLDDSLEKFESEDPRFATIKSRVEELTKDDSTEAFEKLLEENLKFTNNPETLLNEVGLKFYDLYNPEPNALEEVLFFNVA